MCNCFWCNLFLNKQTKNVISNKQGFIIIIVIIDNISIYDYIQYNNVPYNIQIPYNTQHNQNSCFMKIMYDDVFILLMYLYKIYA